MLKKIKMKNNNKDEELRKHSARTTTGETRRVLKHVEKGEAKATRTELKEMKRKGDN